MKPGENLTILDKLIDDLAQEATSQCELLRDHLEAARAFYLGVRPEDYLFSLRFAETILNQLTDLNLRGRVEEFIRGELQSVNAVPRERQFVRGVG